MSGDSGYAWLEVVEHRSGDEPEHSYDVSAVPSVGYFESLETYGNRCNGKLAQMMERRYYDHKSHHLTKLQPNSVFVHAVLEMVAVGEIVLDVLAGYLSSSTLITDLIKHDRYD